MNGWVEYGAAFAIFLTLHAAPVRPSVKARLVATFGNCGFTILYSGVSVLALSWLIVAAGRAPYVALWSVAGWQAWVPILLMLPVCLLVALGLGRPNPFSFGGGQAGFDANRPGIVRLHRHPLLLALALWSGAHVFPNGDLAHVLMFGVFFLFSLLGMKLIDRRRSRLQGAYWKKTLAAVNTVPLKAITIPMRGIVTRLALGLLAYVVLLVLHAVLLGVSPLP